MIQELTLAVMHEYADDDYLMSLLHTNGSEPSRGIVPFVEPSQPVILKRPHK